MKKMSSKNARSTIIVVWMIIGALFGPFVGWRVEGWTSWHHYLQNEPLSVIMWLVIGLIAGMVVGIACSTQVKKDKGDKDD